MSMFSKTQKAMFVLVGLKIILVILIELQIII